MVAGSRIQLGICLSWFERRNAGIFWGLAPIMPWTRKEKGKTVSVAMSREQYEAMAEAIANWKKARQILRRMEQVSRRIIFTTLPDTRRAKPLTDEVLGLS